MKNTFIIVAPFLFGFFQFLAELVFQTRNNSVHGDNQETTGATGGVKNTFFVARRKHLDGHVHDVTWGEEFTPVAAEVRANKFFISLAFDVDVRVEQRVFLQFTDNIGQTARLEFYFVAAIENA